MILRRAWRSVGPDLRQDRSSPRPPVRCCRRRQKSWWNRALDDPFQKFCEYLESAMQLSLFGRDASVRLPDAISVTSWPRSLTFYTWLAVLDCVRRTATSAATSAAMQACRELKTDSGMGVSARVAVNARCVDANQNMPIHGTLPSVVAAAILRLILVLIPEPPLVCIFEYSTRYCPVEGTGQSALCLRRSGCDNAALRRCATGSPRHE